MSDIKIRFEALRDAFNAHDLDAIMARFAEDCVLEMPRGPHPWGARAEGKPAVREALAERSWLERALAAWRSGKGG